MPIRQHEQQLLKRMENRLTYVVENPTAVSRKVNVLLQSYFSRDAVTTDLREDTLRILPTCLRLLHVAMGEEWHAGDGERVFDEHVAEAGDRGD